jgi:hypothetical protein
VLVSGGGDVGVSVPFWKTAEADRRAADAGSTKMAAITNTVATKMKREVRFISN